MLPAVICRADVSNLTLHNEPTLLITITTHYTLRLTSLLCMKGRVLFFIRVCTFVPLLV